MLDFILILRRPRLAKLNTMNEQQRGSHPKGLYILFTTEMWERFNYYGMRAILILFMTKALLFDKAFSSNLYGSYISLIYLTGIIGGYVADRYWGNSRSIITGGFVMAIGELVLFICGSVYNSSPALASVLFYSGLGLMVTGNGFFKPNISSLVGQLYPRNDRRLDSAYTIFYMGINTGGALGPIVCGFVGDTGSPADFKWSFLVAGIGMLISVAIQRAFQKKYVVSPEKVPLGTQPPNAPAKAFSPLYIVGGLILLSAIMIGIFYVDAARFSFLSYMLLGAALVIFITVLSDKALTRVEKQRVIAIFVVSTFVVFFWGAYEQAGASLTFFADEQTDRRLGLHIRPYWIYGISLVALFFVYRLLQKTSQQLGPYDRQLKNTVLGLLILLGLAIVGCNLYLMSLSKGFLTVEELPASTFQSFNSIFIILFAPLFAWLWLKMGRYEPASPLKMSIGLFLLAMGFLWIAYGVNNVTTKVSMIWLTGLYMLHTWGELCLSPIGLSFVNKLSPLKFSSLLMGVWFLSNAGGNKLAGVLSSFYPEKGRSTSFLGYQMHNLHDFFMLFVFMSGAAAVILFFLSRKLQRMMHEGS